MSELTISSERLTAFAAHLRAEERSPGTIENYLRHIRAFAVWLDGSPVTKETAAAWKEHLLTQDYAPATVNAMLAALNGLFHFLGWDGCRVKFLRVQRRLFRDAGRELTRPEYERLMETARSRGQERLALLMETICATGIRVSEVQYITMEAAKRGRTDIFLKGKIRTILLPEKLAGARSVTKPNFFGTANAIGSAISKVSGNYEQLIDYNQIPRDQALEQAKEQAVQLAVDAGAIPETVEIIEVEDVPLAYCVGNTCRVRVKAAGDLA